MRSTAGALMPHGRMSERQIAALAAWTLLVVLALVAVVLVVRRIGGALVQPLGLAGLMATAVACVGMAAIVRRSLCRAGFVLSSRESVRRKELLICLAITVITISILAAVTLPGTPAAAAGVGWFLVVACEAASWLLALRRRRSVVQSESTLQEEEPKLPANLLQQVTRVLDETGGESVHAVLRAVVPAGDRQGTVHVAFCPPLVQAPQLVAHALDGAADVRITQAETFGARLELRLPATAAEDQGVLVEVIGSVRAAQSA